MYAVFNKFHTIMFYKLKYGKLLVNNCKKGRTEDNQWFLIAHPNLISIRRMYTLYKIFSKNLIVTMYKDYNDENYLK